ncbi:MAG: right-handed parallel beta-helix repeat-containing protein, partial [Bacteroidales bacterium]
MKRILLVIIILTIPVFTFASIFTGSGTYSDPYSGGTLTGDQTWSLSSSPIYVSGDLTIGTSSVAGHLTIEAGVTVIFVSTGADIIITGLGQLTANGSSGAQIRFTADNNKNGIYGESGETWGHIAFWSMGVAGPSSLQFCLIEFGRKDGSPETPEGVGGGLLVDFNNITISDCIFRYNYASFGGGIFVNLGKNPSISRCSFFQNTANAAGGGIYLYNSSASIISNCIFDNNYAAGNGNPSYSGGAIQLGSSITDAEILNCTFVNNSAANTGGDALHFYNGGTVVNSIFWGSNNQIGFSGSNGIVDYSAIQGYSAQSHFTNCFGLNSSNDLDGPNFKNPTSKDWSIKVVSPCRDAGTTPSPTVPTDYIGNSRIGAYDIGAYEVQYTGWKTNPGNTDWNTASNWNPGSV